MSRINWNRQLLCGIDATGEIFKFCGILLLIIFHFITLAKQYLTFSNVYFMIAETALFVFAETRGPWLSDVIICGTVQFGVKYIGHPLQE